MLHLLYLVAIVVLLTVAGASPHPQVDSESSTSTNVVVTVTSTFTTLTVPTASATLSTSSTASDQPITQPTSWLSVIAIRSGSPIHLLAMNAAGRRFYLGGSTMTYCPENLQAQGYCPAGNTTVISLCSMVRSSSPKAWFFHLADHPRRELLFQVANNFT